MSTAAELRSAFWQRAAQRKKGLPALVVSAGPSMGLARLPAGSAVLSRRQSVMRGIALPRCGSVRAMSAMPHLVADAGPSGGSPAPVHRGRGPVHRRVAGSPGQQDQRNGVGGVPVRRYGGDPVGQGRALQDRGPVAADGPDRTAVPDHRDEAGAAGGSTDEVTLVRAWAEWDERGSPPRRPLARADLLLPGAGRRPGPPAGPGSSCHHTRRRSLLPGGADGAPVLWQNGPYRLR